MRRSVTVGEKFGRLTIIKRISMSGARQTRWAARCECGNKKDVDSTNLLNGSTQSCGCIPKGHRTTHGMSDTRIHNIWLGMHYRCNNQKDPAYHGRGISVAPEWATFEGFYTDMGATYADDLTIERVDVNSNYCKANCTWIPFAEQHLNKQNTLRVDVDGEMLCLKTVCKDLELDYNKIWLRIFRLGWTVREALNFDKRAGHKHGGKAY